jgi:hypothetical protein
MGRCFLPDADEISRLSNLATSAGDEVPLQHQNVRLGGKIEDCGDFVDFYTEFSELEKDSFLSRFPEPFFLQNSGFVPTESLPKFLFKLVTAYAGTDKEPPFNIQVWALKETSMFGGPQALTIGRVEGNDIVIPHKRISKNHATLMLPTDRWMISDSGSTNGTFLQGSQIEPNKPQHLGSGAEINFGHGAIFHFMLGGYMHQLLAQIRTEIEKRTGKS